MANQKVEPFTGDLDDYAKWLTEQADDGDVKEAATGEHTQAARKAKRKDGAERRKALQPLRSKVKKLEQQLDKLHKREAELNESLADTSLYEESEKGRLMALTTEHAQIKGELDEVEEEWMLLSEELESA